jgi:hypothetical protein
VARAKNTGRADARRRYREQRRAELEPNTLSVQASAGVVASEPPRRSLFQMPDVAGDLRALPGMFLRKPLLWLPFALLLVAFAVVLAVYAKFLPTGVVGDVAVFYAGMVLPPPPLVIYFIGGFLAPRGSWLVGVILGIFYSVLITILSALAPGATEEVSPGSGALITESLVATWVMSIAFGGLAGGFAAWYRNFLRSSQERARANRLAREREQAQKAKEQARADRAAQRQAATTARSTGPTPRSGS